MRDVANPRCRTSSKAGRIRAYLDTLAVPDLSMEDMTRIEEVGSSVVKRKYNGFLVRTGVARYLQESMWQGAFYLSRWKAVL